MGLDGVELIMSWEEAFDIVISDEEAQNTQTPRDAINLIMQKVSLEETSAPCLSQKAFHILRLSFTSLLPINRRGFRPATKLKDILKRPERKELWQKLQEHSGVGSFPELERPRWCINLIILLSGLALISIPMLTDYSVNAGLLIGIIPAVFTSFFCMYVTRPLKYDFSHHKTVGDLVRYVVANHAQDIKSPGRKWTREEIAAIVRESIIEQLGVSDFTEDSHFIDDIGID